MIQRRELGCVKVLIVCFSLFHVAPPPVITALLRSGKNEMLIVSFSARSHCFRGCGPLESPRCVWVCFDGRPQKNAVEQIQSNRR